MRDLGKTPSKYNGSKHVVGIASWTSHKATQKDIATWQNQPDYGICIQTRNVRAIDIDVPDKQLAQSIQEDIQGFLDWMGLPTRYRENSGKCLLAFRLPGGLSKRIIRMGDKGIIEFLANGQQFIAAGTHPSGARYQWLDLDGMPGLPDGIPQLTMDEFENLWSHLATTYAEEGSTQSVAPTKAKVLNAAIENDADAQFLIANDWVKATEKDGRLHITCPFEEEHTSPSAISATTYFPANTGGYQLGHYQCLHAHCEHRTDDDFRQAIGIPVEDPFADFEDISEGDNIAEPTGDDKATKRFSVVPVSTFSEGAPPEWIVKGVIPRAELVVVFGESGSGKSFFITDLAACIARGEPWRGHRVTQGGIVYVAAEGSGGMRNRMRAYSNHHNIDLVGLPFGVIADAPNFMAAQDVKDVIHAVRAFGKTSLIVVDTFAQVMAGSNENAGEDVGKALKHCRELHKHTGATVVLVHHSGKDASKGARGWSGLRAAADAEIEVSRCDDDRVATITKMKDGMDGEEFGFKLATVLLCKDLDDEDVTSCVIEHVEGGASRASLQDAKKKGKHGANERLVLLCLNELMEVGEGRVAADALFGAVVGQMLPPAPGSKRDRRREMAMTATHNLRDRGEVLIKDGFVSFPGEEQ